MEKVPRKEYTKPLPVKIEVDQEQFSKLHLQRWIDSESDSTDTVYNRRRKVMLKRAERDFEEYQNKEREARRAADEEEEEEREARREIKEENERDVRREEDDKRKRMNTLPENREPPPPPSRYSETQYKGDYYYNRSYAERFPRTGAGSSDDHVRQRRSYYQKSYPNPPFSPRSIQKEARKVDEIDPRKLEVMIPFKKFLTWKMKRVFCIQLTS